MSGGFPKHRCRAAPGHTAGTAAVCLPPADRADARYANAPLSLDGLNGDPAPALEKLRRPVALDPDNGPIANTCGWVHFRLDRAADALPYLQDAAFLTNNDAVVLQHLGDTYLKLDRRRDEIAIWRRALEKDPGNRDLAARMDAALAQANDAHLRYAPTR